MKIWFHFIFLSINLTAFSQGSLQGRVEDDHNEALIGANIAISGSGKGTIADQSGNFRLANISPGNYQLEVSLSDLLHKQFQSK